MMNAKMLFSMILALAALTFGQVGFSIDAEGGYASNIFANYRQLPDYYQNFQGYLNYDALSEGAGLRAFYQGAATLFENYDARSYSLHQVGLSFYNYINESEQQKLNLGINATMRLHREEYQWYEYKQGYFFANYKTALRPQLYGYIGVNSRVRAYDNLRPYSYLQHVAFLRLSSFFNSGTSLIAELDFMHKDYLHDEATPGEFAELQTDGDGQNQQLIGILRVAQAVTLKTGLSAQLTVRRNLTSSVRYLIDAEGYYYSDEELFDDPFGYEAEQFDIALKQKLPWKIQVELAGAYLMKHYSNRLALDLDGYPFIDLRLRGDQRFIGQISLSKAWHVSRSIAPMIFSIDLSFTRNDSNDPYYIYNTRYFSVGFSQSF
ncbi:DUF560 domain-containing protein [candidate division KSB1 bacterium]|nr:DUF560 domain-containing protein [candidate division KSB1 bacterium]RQW02195.1 MAG: DUF560 domain-containing protein [candidate division KSB1 bacterium]